MKINKKIGQIVLGTFGVMGLVSIAFSNLPLLEAAVPTGVLPNSSAEINQAFTGQIPVAIALQNFQVSALPTCNSTTTTTVNSNGVLLTAGPNVIVMAANVTVAIAAAMVNVGATSTGANISPVICSTPNNSVAQQWVTL